MVGPYGRVTLAPVPLHAIGGRHLACRLCTWLCDRFCADFNASIWDRSDPWERAHSNEYDLWSAETDGNRALIEQAYGLDETDPEAAFRIRLEAAQSGSVWAMELVAWHYDTGTLVEADFGQAQQYYRDALSAGSWMATIKYAQLLAKHGHFELCESLLEDGVRSDFVPAHFWLAWFRVKQSRSRKTCREIRPLLEHAAEQGHPGAKLVLARLMARGKFGLRAIPESFRLFREVAAPPATA